MSNISSKVRAVYEALEMRKNKQALKLLVPLLEKKPQSGQLRILKALALVRSGKKDEALKTASDLKSSAEVQGDEHLLNNLAVVFREAGVPAEATECFQNALTRQPQNEDLHLAVFNSFGREKAFLKQQQAAQKMAKQFGKEEYQLWPIVCTLLQVIEGAQPKLLSLAERQLAKRADEGKLKTYEELRLYLEILERQNKFQEAIDTIEGNLGSIYTSQVERLQKKAFLLQRLEQWGKALEVYKELLTINEGQVKGNEEWRHVRGIIDCLLASQGLDLQPYQTQPLGGTMGGTTLPVPSVEGLHLNSPPRSLSVEEEGTAWGTVLSESKLLISGLAEVKEGQRRSRTQLLASLEIESRYVLWQKMKGKPVTAEDAVNTIIEYAEAYGDKDVCAYDIIGALRRLPAESYATVLQRLEEKSLGLAQEFSSPEGGTSEFEGYWQRQSMAVKTRRLLGTNKKLVADQGATMTEVGTLLRGFKLCSENVVRKPGYKPERTPSDELCLVAARLLVDMYWIDGKEHHLLDAAIVVRYGLEISPTNFQFKILLLRIYRYLGASEAIFELFVDLDIKHILLDTLSYIVLGGGYQWCQISKVKFCYELVMRLDRDNKKDTPEYTYQAFRYQTYSKISELLAFERRLQSSVQIITARAELVNLGLLDQGIDVKAYLQTSSPLIVQTEETTLENLVLVGEVPRLKGEQLSLRDNRDVTLEVAWEYLEDTSRSDFEISESRQQYLRDECRATSLAPYVLAESLGFSLFTAQQATSAAATLTDGIARLESLLSVYKDLLDRLGWVNPAASHKDQPSVQDYWDALTPSDNLSMEAWSVSLLLGQTSLQLHKLVAAVKNSDGESSSSTATAVGGMADEIARKCGVLQKGLVMVWNIKEDSNASGPSNGYELGVGIQALNSWCLRVYSWAPHLLTYWFNLLAESTPSKKSAKGCIPVH